MADCTFFEMCLLRSCLPRFSLALAHDWERTYCKASYTQCARFLVAEVAGPERVPPSLLPHETDRAMLVLAEIHNGAAQ